VAGVALELAKSGEHLFGGRVIDFPVRVERFAAFVDVECASGAEMVIIQGSEDYRPANYQ
jgi:hypothetical protein